MKIGYFGLNQGVFCEPDAMVRLVRVVEGRGLRIDLDRGARGAYRPAGTAVSRSARDADAGHCGGSRVRGSAQRALEARLGDHPAAAAQPGGVGQGASRNRRAVERPTDLRRGSRLRSRRVRGHRVPFEERGPRTSEHIEAIRTLWTQDKPTFSGRFTSFSGIQSHPRPVQRPHPPILIGGMSAAAYRRAVRHGDGWYGFFQDLEATANALRGLAEAAKRVERPADLGPLEITITPPAPSLRIRQSASRIWEWRASCCCAGSTTWEPDRTRVHRTGPSRSSRTRRASSAWLEAKRPCRSSRLAVGRAESTAT